LENLDNSGLFDDEQPVRTVARIADEDGTRQNRSQQASAESARAEYSE
jgi:hypothetical protein